MSLQAAKKFVPKFILHLYREYKRKKEMHAFAGNNVLCPICNATFKEFGVQGSEKRANARCLSCGSLERHRLLWKYLHATTNIFTNTQKMKVLHVAPEKCFYDAFAKNKNITYVPCDLYPEVYDYGGKAKITKVDVTNIPFAENFFDVIICNHVLEHVTNDTVAMAELFRVMKNGGWGIFQVPIDYNRQKTFEDDTIITPEGRKKAFGQGDHVRIYGNDYKDRLALAGFTVKEDGYVNTFSKEQLAQLALMPSEIIYYCTK
jgi:SAM-dependent methyltransferase